MTNNLDINNMQPNSAWKVYIVYIFIQLIAIPISSSTFALQI